MIQSALLSLLVLPVMAFSQVTFTGSPNPFPPGLLGGAQINLTWSAPGVSTTEVRIGSPTGALFASGGSSGTASTGPWVIDGMQFFLQDVSGGEPGVTLSTVTAHAALPDLPAGTNILISYNNGQSLYYSAPQATIVEIHLYSPSGPLVARYGSQNQAIDVGSWVVNGTHFYLQDVSNGHPLTTDYTLAAAVATVDSSLEGKAAFIGATPGVIADPNNSGTGLALIYWDAPSTSTVEIHLGSPNGPLFASGASSGTAETGQWIADGTRFFLQDATSGDPTLASNTLGIATVDLQPPMTPYLAVVLPASGFDKVRVFNAGNGHMAGEAYLPDGASVQSLLPSPDGSLIYAFTAGAIYVIDPATSTSNQVVPLQDFYGTGSWIKGADGEDLILATNDVGEFSVIDPKAKEIVATRAIGASLGCRLCSTAYDPIRNKTYLFVLNSANSGTLSALSYDLTYSSTSVAIPAIQGFNIFTAVGPMFFLKNGSSGTLVLTVNWNSDDHLEPAVSEARTIDLATLGTEAVGSDSTQLTELSLDGSSIYGVQAFWQISSFSRDSFVLHYTQLERYAVLQDSNGKVYLSLVSSVPEPVDVDSFLWPGPVGEHYVWMFSTSAKFYDELPGADYYIDGPAYVYKADAASLQPLTTVNFIEPSTDKAAYIFGYVSSTGSFLFR